MVLSSPVIASRTTLESICRVAEKAGVEALRFYGRASLTLKSDSSPLTDADKASHEYIVEALPRIIAGIPVISEESQDDSHAHASPTARFWLVDPLDGTKEFLKATGEFTVNIAFIDGGRPILGVVHAPAIGLTYFAASGLGAFRQEKGASPQEIHGKPADLQHARVVASKDHAGPLVQTLLSRLPGAQLKSMGSSLKFCLVAAGEADIYLRDVPTMEWDTAAAQCVVETAGGKVCTLDGKPLGYGKMGLKNEAIITIGDVTLPWEALLKV